MNEALSKVLKRLHYPQEVMLTCVRWYVAYPLSLRHIEEMMRERGVFVDHTTIHGWALKILPVLAVAFRCCKRPVGNSWRMDETCWSQDNGSISIAPSTVTAPPSTFCSRPSAIWPQRAASWNAPSASTACLTRS